MVVLLSTKAAAPCGLKGRSNPQPFNYRYHRRKGLCNSTAGKAQASMAMRYSGLTFFLSCFLIQLVHLTVVHSHCIPESGNYTNGSSYQADLNSLLNTFSNTQLEDGFYNSSVGEVNGIGLCRGDISLETCQSCITNASQDILRECPNYKEAVVYLDNCTLRYSNRSIFGTPEISPATFAKNAENFSDPDVSRDKRDSLLLQLRETAASGGSRKKFATGETAADLQAIYALVQCTPDLEQQECVDCLADLSSAAAAYLRYSEGGSARGPSCGLRYEIYPFYESSPDAPPPSPPSFSPPPPTNATAGDGKSKVTRNIVIIVISAVVFVVLVSCIWICICLRRRKPKDKEETHDEDDILEVESLQFSFASIRNATDNFSDSNKLGQGGFGPVYKGRLSNGQDIAVKRLSAGSGQGELEFKNEVLLVAKLQHRNLARLLGFCLEGTERLLVYEFVANASLDHFLFDPIKRSHLYWERRYKIIVGTARGLLYLHEDSRLRIIHRDLKASNILLDDELNPKISDFGMAKLFSLDQTQGDTNRIVGTYGYMAPEYVMYGNFSIKSDVYSFGILILEIVSGKKNTSFNNGENMEGLTNFAWRCWRERSTSNLIDPSLNSGTISEIMRCIHIGLLCVQENPADRPTMASIVLMLSSHSLTLPLPSQPGFSMSTGTEHSAHDTTKQETPFLHGRDSGVTNSSDNGSAQMSMSETSTTDLYPR